MRLIRPRFIRNFVFKAAFYVVVRAMPSRPPSCMA
jgi:hypothetical protein